MITCCWCFWLLLFEVTFGVVYVLWISRCELTSYLGMLVCMNLKLCLLGLDWRNKSVVENIGIRCSGCLKKKIKIIFFAKKKGSRGRVEPLTSPSHKDTNTTLFTNYAGAPVSLVLLPFIYLKQIDLTFIHSLFSSDKLLTAYWWEFFLT